MKANLMRWCGRSLMALTIVTNVVGRADVFDDEDFDDEDTPAAVTQPRPGMPAGMPGSMSPGMPAAMPSAGPAAGPAAMSAAGVAGGPVGSPHMPPQAWNGQAPAQPEMWGGSNGRPPQWGVDSGNAGGAAAGWNPNSAPQPTGPFQQPGYSQNGNLQIMGPGGQPQYPGNGPAYGPSNGAAYGPTNGPAYGPTNGAAGYPNNGPANYPNNGPTNYPSNGSTNYPSNGSFNNPQPYPTNAGNGGFRPNGPIAPINGQQPNGFDPARPNGAAMPNDGGFSNGPVASNGPVTNGPITNGPATMTGLEQHNGGFFKIMKPAGWQVSTFGTGATLAYVVRDPSCAARQFFVISQCALIGDETFKQQFVAVQQQMGQDVSDAPIIRDMTPEGFLRGYNAIARMRLTQQMFPAAPLLEGVQIVSSQPMSSMYDQMGAKGAVMRATFNERGIASDGFFFVAVNQYPGMSFGTAMNFVGCTAPTGQLEQLQPIAQKCIDSLQFDPAYIQQQQQLQQQSFRDGQARHQAQWDRFNAGQKAHQQQVAAYDAQNAAWWDRQKGNEINHRQWLDGFNGIERVVNPTTNETYTMNYGDYQNYDLNRQQFEMNNLQQVPYNMQNYELLNQYAQDGYQYIR